MGKLKQFNKYDTAEDAMGIFGANCTEDKCNCKHLNISKKED